MKGKDAMKKILSLTVITLLALSVISVVPAPAVTVSTRQPTGTDYLALSKDGRVRIVTALIDGAKEGGVKIKQTPVTYCRKLDVLYARHPDMKSRDLALTLKTLIVMDYDWTQKGVDKDQLARQFLDESTYQKNKARLR